jgi:hypothetical protein
LGGGFTISQASLDHLAARHPDMLGRLAAVAEAIAAPEAVTRSRLLWRCENFYRRYGDRRYVRVSVLFRPTPAGWDGEVLTAHLLRAIDEKETRLWP